MAKPAGASDGKLRCEASSDAHVETPAAKRITATRSAAALGLLAFAALAIIGGWQSCRFFVDHRNQVQQHQLVEAARQGAINLTTIDHTTADDDVKRILDSSTGLFHDDFQKRAQPFVEVVKKAQSKSEGTVTAAALESRDGDTAQVLVVVSVRTTTAAGAEPEPRIWRMRVGVQRTGDAARVSDVQFVS